MNRFTRYSCVSPLELCLEAERRAWHCGAVLFVLFFVLAALALFHPAPEERRTGGGDTDFAGICVESTGVEVPRGQAPEALPLPPVPVAEVVPEVLWAVDVPQPQHSPVPEWELMELEAVEPLLELELPQALVTASQVPAGRDAGKSADKAGERPEAASAPEAGDFVAAAYRSCPHPPYPANLLQRRVQGRVVLRIVVDKEGVPQKVELSAPSGHEAFDRCACEWVRSHWRFHPARRNGMPVASVVRTQIEFVMR